MKVHLIIGATLGGAVFRISGYFSDISNLNGRSDTYYQNTQNCESKELHEVCEDREKLRNSKSLKFVHFPFFKGKPKQTIRELNGSAVRQLDCCFSLQVYNQMRWLNHSKLNLSAMSELIEPYTNL